MAKTYSCRDVGVDCDWKTNGSTEDEVMASISEHAAQVHPTIELTPELVAAVRSVIKDGYGFVTRRRITSTEKFLSK